MKYISTRGKSAILNFKETFLAGLASDGGLYVPETYPFFSANKISSFKKLSYTELCYEIFLPFIGKEIPAKKLKELIKKAYNESVFNHQAIAPLKQLNQKHYILELFHGPTNAFKDFALQLMGLILAYFLNENKEKAIILGATSGDTGSAAIHGCKKSKRADIYIIHPHNRTSEIQRKQMTTVKDKNVFNIALKGNFDDAQNIVKHIFCNQEFIGGKKRLIAVNSINWVRIMGQIVYYFYSALALGAPTRKVSYAVPTGNFGDIFAGYVARKMGLPIDKLIIATNKNDILARFINNNSYKRKKLNETLSPSMDIQISSNFERLLFDMHDNDANKIRELMLNFKEKGEINVSTHILNNIKQIFKASKSSDRETIKTMHSVFAKCHEIIDPHTATAIKAAVEFEQQIDGPIISLATAHPGKFPNALKKAKLKLPYLPDSLAKPLKEKEKFKIFANDANQISEYIAKNSL